MPEQRNRPCDDCPVAAKLKLVKAVIERQPEAFNQTGQRQQALGSIALCREVISGLVQAVGCDGPRYADGAYLTCPLQRELKDIGNLILGPDKSIVAVYDSSVFGTETAAAGDQRPSGQYL